MYGKRFRVIFIYIFFPHITWQFHKINKKKVDFCEFIKIGELLDFHILNIFFLGTVGVFFLAQQFYSIFIFISHFLFKKNIQKNFFHQK